MTPTPADVLARAEGTLAETPLPALLHAIFEAERTVTLDLKLRGLEKRIQFEDGAPVACRSNLLHETLGKFLVERKKLTEAEYQKALAESVQSGKRMGELLTAQGRLSAFELYKLMQQNLALKILEAFRWGEASWRLHEEQEQAELALRMNPAQLVLTGCAGFVPFEVVATQLAFTDDQRFALSASPRHAVADLKLSTKEAKLVQVLRRRPTFDEAMTASGLDVEEAMRRLYALSVLGIVELVEGGAEVVQTSTQPQSSTSTSTQSSTSTSTPKPPPARPEPVEGRPADPEPLAPAALPEETDALRDALVSAYLDHRGKDPFDLLGVPESAGPAELRRAFLAVADRFAPLRFRSADLREKAEALLAAAARAYGALADAEQAAVWRKRRAAAAEKARGAPRPGAAEQFRISTSLLDASTQFAEGKRRLEAGNHRGALEYFQYAADIEPKALHRAHLAWARYLVDPERHARLALAELAEVAKADPSGAEAHFFTGEILRTLSRHADAEEAYRRAFKADPQHRRAQDLALEMMRARKAGA